MRDERRNIFLRPLLHFRPVVTGLGRMKIKESKNIKYEHLPRIGPSEEYEKIEPNECFLVSFERTDDKLVLYFKNRSQAVIKALNINGGREIDLIEEKLNGSIGKHYEEILNINL